MCPPAEHDGNDETACCPVRPTQGLTHPSIQCPCAVTVPSLASAAAWVTRSAATSECHSAFRGRDGEAVYTKFFKRQVHTRGRTVACSGPALGKVRPRTEHSVWIFYRYLPSLEPSPAVCQVPQSRKAEPRAESGFKARNLTTAPHVCRSYESVWPSRMNSIITSPYSSLAMPASGTGLYHKQACLGEENLIFRAKSYL